MLTTNYGDLNIELDPKTGRAKVTKATVLKHGRDLTANLAYASSETMPVRRATLPLAFRNKTEARYGQYLEALRYAGEIADWRYEAVCLRWAKKTSWLPDFLVIYPDGRQAFHEIKGWIRDAAAVKIKTVATIYWWWPIYIVKWKRGQWEIVRVSK